MYFNFILGKTGEITKKPIENDDGEEKTDSSEDEDVCTYNCQESGGCSVRIVSTGFVSGNTLGSCFSEQFGGECSGIPERCDKCIQVCKGKSGEQFSLPAKEEWDLYTL